VMIMSHKPHLFKAIVLALIAGCSSHPTRVDCEGHLRPVNAPAPVTSEGASHP
jgi:hypothetical protein